MNKWLQNFVYRINPTLVEFVLAASITFFIALLTVSYQSFKAAFSDPVECLRYE
jgi:putative ABC transport system permease protein